MIIFDSEQINKEPLIKCIKKTEILSELNKRILLKELNVVGMFNFVKKYKIPSEEEEIKKLFEMVLPYNENGLEILMKEYYDLVK